MGKAERKWQDTEYVLSFFGDGRAGRRNYRKYVEEGIVAGYLAQVSFTFGRIESTARR